MKRLYVTTKAVWEGPAADLSGNPLNHTSSQKMTKVNKHGKIELIEQSLVIPVRHIDLFHPHNGSHYLTLDDTHILVAVDVENNEFVMEVWHGHPEIARLPHPIHEGKVTLHDAVNQEDHIHKKFKQKHLESLLQHPALGIKLTDNVLDVSRKSKALHPLVCISHVI